LLAGEIVEENDQTEVETTLLSW